MRNHIFVLFFLIFGFSCSVQQQRELLLDGEYYTIDLDRKKTDVINLSSLFGKPKTVILETNNNCLIGQINELQVFDGCIYILDVYIAKSLFIFSMDGSFIRKIGNLGKAPGEYLSITDFTLDTKHHFIYLLDNGNRVHKYQMNGVYVNTLTIQIPRTNANFIQYYDNWLYTDAHGWTPTIDDYLLLKIDPERGEVISRSLPVSYNKGWDESFYTDHNFFVSRLGDPPKYTQLFMNYIVSLGEQITPHIVLKSKHLVTAQDIKNLTGRMDQKYEDIRKSSKIYNIHSYVENENIIFFHYWYGRTTNVALVNKRTNSTVLANMVNNDLIYKEDGVVYPFKFSDTKGVYEVPDSYWLTEFQNAVKDGKTVHGIDKVEQLMKLDEESNPVIFYYEYKDAE